MLTIVTGFCPFLSSTPFLLESISPVDRMNERDETKSCLSPVQLVEPVLDAVL